jgi:hypothetical protein
VQHLQTDINAIGEFAGDLAASGAGPAPARPSGRRCAGAVCGRCRISTWCSSWCAAAISALPLASGALVQRLQANINAMGEFAGGLAPAARGRRQPGQLLAGVSGAACGPHRIAARCRRWCAAAISALSLASGAPVPRLAVAVAAVGVFAEGPTARGRRQSGQLVAGAARGQYRIDGRCSSWCAASISAYRRATAVPPMQCLPMDIDSVGDFPVAWRHRNTVGAN